MDNNRKSIFKYTFLSSCLTGMVCYLYFMANNLDNYDNIENKPSGFGVGLPSGRWFLSILGNMAEKIWYYNSSYFNCIFSIIILGFVNILLVHIFKIRNKRICLLLSAITVAFPSIADTMFFSFTVHYYMVAILSGVLGIYFIQKIPMAENILKKFLLIILSGCFYACSLGVYQAYYPFIAAILVLCLIEKCLDKNENWKNILNNSIYYLVSLASGYVIYRIILKLCLMVFNRELVDYKGINKMGVIELKQIPSLLYETYSSYIMLFKKDFISINANFIVKVIIFVIYLYILCSLFFIWKKLDILKFAELCIFIVILPLASNSIIIMVPESDIRTMMSMGTISVFYLPLLFFDKVDFEKNDKGKHIIGQALSCLISLVVLNYIWISNVNYNALYYANKKTENYFERLYCRIESVEGYNENMPVIFVGKNISGTSFVENWGEIQYYGGNILAYGQLNAYSRDNFILNYLGKTYSEITEEQYSQYKGEIDQMDKYPNDKSVKVIDGNVFVKLE